MRAYVVGLMTVGATAVATPAIGQQQTDWDAIEIGRVEVADGLYFLTGRGGNIGVSVGEDGPFIVDDQFAPLTAKIRAAIAEVSDGDVRFVLNTHWHGDHTGGNENFGEAGAMIVAHENVRRRLNPEEFREVMGRTQQAPPDALPVVTFTDGVTFYWNNEKIQVFHVEHAHTDGDAIVFYTNANSFHMGDVFFQGRYPFVDVQSGGSIGGIIHAADRVLGMANSETKIIPGHGALSGPDDLRAYRDMLMVVRDRVRALINDGRSEDEVVAARPTADLDATWGQNPENFVRAAYQSLAGN